MPLFTIIIPTYNRAKAIKRCLDSLVIQTFKDFDIVVCDDGSNDNTRDIVGTFVSTLNIKYCWQPNWGGPARPRNIGIQIAEGDWICFLDSDDWWYPNKLEECAKHIHGNDLIYHNLDSFTISGKGATIRSTQLKQPIFIDLISTKNVIQNSSVVVRKQLLSQVGGICEDRRLISVEDYDTWLSISRINHNFYFLEKTLGAYWFDGQTNISSTIPSTTPEYVLLKKHIQYVPKKQRSSVLQKRLFCMARIAHSAQKFSEAKKTYLKSIYGPDITTSIKSIILLLLTFIHKNIHHK